MPKENLIVIDPGHSGDPDPGACGAYSQESTVAWQIALKVRDRLVNQWKQRVILTKQNENDPASDSLYSRYSLANNEGADLFVSIHLNAASESAHGTETFSAPGSYGGAALAACIQGQLVACLGLTDRGIKTANYSVLVNTDMTAALTEVCFISNPEEEDYINQESTQDKAAAAISQGIIDYLVTKEE